MMGLLRCVLLIGAVAYLGIMLFMYLQQRSLQYFPAAQGIAAAGAWASPASARSG